MRNSERLMARFSARTALLSIALVVAGVSFSLANEVIPIGTILKNPESYNLRVVTLEGTVRDVKPYKPYFQPFRCGVGVCYGAYTFMLVDEGGSLEVEHPVLDKKPGVKVPEVSEGERVIIEAQILAPGRYMEHGKGMTEERKTVQAMVKSMRRP